VGGKRLEKGTESRWCFSAKAGHRSAKKRGVKGAEKRIFGDENGKPQASEEALTQDTWGNAILFACGEASPENPKRAKSFCSMSGRGNSTTSLIRVFKRGERLKKKVYIRLRSRDI